MALAEAQLPQDIQLEEGNCVTVKFPDIVKRPITRAGIKTPNTKTGTYRIVQIDRKRDIYWIENPTGITVAKRHYITDFASDPFIEAA